MSLGLQRGRLQLAEHVQVVVAGGPVGAEGDIDTGIQQARHRAMTGGELQIGFGAVHHLGAAVGEQAYLVRLELGHVHRDQPGVDQVEPMQAFDRALSVLLDTAPHLGQRLVQVHVDRDIEFVGELGQAAQRRVGDGVGGMRCKGGAHQWVVAELIVHRDPLVEVLIGIGGPCRRKVDQDQADRRRACRSVQPHAR